MGRTEARATWKMERGLTAVDPMITVAHARGGERHTRFIGVLTLSPRKRRSSLPHLDSDAPLSRPIIENTDIAKDQHLLALPCVLCSKNDMQDPRVHYPPPLQDGSTRRRAPCASVLEPHNKPRHSGYVQSMRNAVKASDFTGSRKRPRLFISDDLECISR